MKNKLSQMPFLRLILPLALGITFALYFPAQFSLIIPAIAFLALLLWNWYDNRNQKFSNRWLFGTFAGIFLFIAGYSVTILKRPFNNESYYEHYLKAGRDSLIVKIVSVPQEKEKTIKATGEIVSIFSDNKQYQTQGKALFYFENDSLSQKIRYGDVLFLRTSLNNIKPPSNPDEFDYCSYLAMHGIYYEAYVRNKEFAYTGKNDAPWLLDLTNRCREKLIVLLNQRIKGNGAAVGSAILLGYRDDLSQSVIQQFADSGTVHVICVAGLHVGILFWLFGMLLLPIERFKHGKLVRTIFLIALLWLYALFTGLATPVIRATVMFSFLSIGRHLGKYTNSINTLAASAFFMLLVNPFSIADTGFQLSYLAVLGILTIYPVLNQLWEPKNYLIEKLWELTCLSISAQMAVMPLSVLYFHQFPNYFVFTNLLIVPLLSVVIYSGVLFFITAYIPFISVVTTWILQKSLLFMNTLVSNAPHLPYFVAKGLSISITESLLLYTILVLLFAFSMNKQYRALVLSLCCFIIFLGIRIYKNHIHVQQQIFAVYNIPRHSTIAFISGKHCITTQHIDSLDFCYHIQYHWWEKGITDSSSTTLKHHLLLSNHLYLDSSYAQFNDTRIGFAGTNLPGKRTKVKYVVISGNYKQDIFALRNAFIFDTLIFDSSVSPYRLKKWKNECEQLHIPYYDVNEQGAFIENS
jgi:competence protein ComEC